MKSSAKNILRVVILCGVLATSLAAKGLCRPACAAPEVCEPCGAGHCCRYPDGVRHWGQWCCHRYCQFGEVCVSSACHEGSECRWPWQVRPGEVYQANSSAEQAVEEFLRLMKAYGTQGVPNQEHAHKDDTHANVKPTQPEPGASKTATNTLPGLETPQQGFNKVPTETFPSLAAGDPLRGAAAQPSVPRDIARGSALTPQTAHHVLQKHYLPPPTGYLPPPRGYLPPPPHKYLPPDEGRVIVRWQ
ncbi:uncharacterized protein LOC122393371 [Amphibalanus amphitrite]|uniref:uncharacterized protein LOC122393371 n=1 Tax=Amphibalanus amphitrite TaxID=1232801 RepID=UPI001C9154FF|nr:uncharacterized protein LOC122393371 [Amphibalanus amphitrite]